MPLFGFKGQSSRSSKSKPQENDAYLACDDLIYCQRLRRWTTGQTAACDVGDDIECVLRRCCYTVTVNLDTWARSVAAENHTMSGKRIDFAAVAVYCVRVCVRACAVPCLSVCLYVSELRAPHSRRIHALTIRCRRHLLKNGHRLYVTI